MSIVNTINRLRRTVGLKDFTPTYSDTEPEPKTTINPLVITSMKGLWKWSRALNGRVMNWRFSD